MVSPLAILLKDGQGREINRRVRRLGAPASRLGPWTRGCPAAFLVSQRGAASNRREHPPRFLIVQALLQQGLVARRLGEELSEMFRCYAERPAGLLPLPQLGSG